MPDRNGQRVVERFRREPPIYPVDTHGNITVSQPSILPGEYPEFEEEMQACDGRIEQVMDGYGRSIDQFVGQLRPPRPNAEQPDLEVQQRVTEHPNNALVQAITINQQRAEELQDAQPQAPQPPQLSPVGRALMPPFPRSPPHDRQDSTGICSLWGRDGMPVGRSRGHDQSAIGQELGHLAVVEFHGRVRYRIKPAGCVNGLKPLFG